MTLLDLKYWDDKYHQHQTAWDIGCASPPLVNYFMQLTEKNLDILIPGCGNAYEADFLVEKGFTNIHLLDISPLLVESLRKKYSNTPQITVHQGDFFEHTSQYDLIVEQTFFCANSPENRPNLVRKIASLLKPSGKYVGVLFGIEFEKEGPPFGGNIEIYKKLFSPFFNIKKLETCYNSIVPRKNNELFAIMIKK